MTEPELLLSARLFRVVRTRQTTPDGKEHPREIIRHPGAVVILPLLDDGRVVLIENYRVAVGQRLVELPAGTLEPDEDLAEAALRELAEETGYRAGSMQRLITFYSSPGFLDEALHLFVATELREGPTDLDSGEDIRTLVVPWPEAMALAGQGRVQDGKSLVGLLYWEVFGKGGTCEAT